MIPSIRRKGAFFSPAICLKVAVVRWSGWRGGGCLNTRRFERAKKKTKQPRATTSSFNRIPDLTGRHGLPTSPPPRKKFPKKLSPRFQMCKNDALVYSHTSTTTNMKICGHMESKLRGLGGYAHFLSKCSANLDRLWVWLEFGKISRGLFLWVSFSLELGDSLSERRLLRHFLGRSK